MRCLASSQRHCLLIPVGSIGQTAFGRPTETTALGVINSLHLTIRTANRDQLSPSLSVLWSEGRLRIVAHIWEVSCIRDHLSVWVSMSFKENGWHWQHHSSYEGRNALSIVLTIPHILVAVHIALCSPGVSTLSIQSKPPSRIKALRPRRHPSYQKESTGTPLIPNPPPPRLLIMVTPVWSTCQT